MALLVKKYTDFKAKPYTLTLLINPNVTSAAENQHLDHQFPKEGLVTSFIIFGVGKRQPGISRYGCGISDPSGHRGKLQPECAHGDELVFDLQKSGSNEKLLMAPIHEIRQGTPHRPLEIVGRQAAAQISNHRSQTCGELLPKPYRIFHSCP